MLGAILIIGSGSAQGTTAGSFTRPGIPLACVEVLGRSVLGRQLGDLRRVGIDSISLLADNNLSYARTELEYGANASVSFVDNVWTAATDQFEAYRVSGFNSVIVVSASSYAELNYSDILQFHKEQAEGITRVVSPDGPIDAWVFDVSALARSEQIANLLRDSVGARYWFPNYVNRLQNPRDLRRLVTDAFNGACRLRPDGFEARPGVWMSESADVHRGARIVAPAYIGRGSRIEEQCLITRCSNIESNCRIDYGTVVEDSMILPNTYVGIGLDISHSVVSGSGLVNLERDVTLEIGDPGVVRNNRVLRKEVSRPSSDAFGLLGVH